MNRTIKALAFALAGLAAWAGLPAAAQDNYPSRNVRLIVSFPPGGGVDAVARLFADKLTTILGQPVVVENRGGAAGLIAGRAVAAAEPDGYTVLVATNSMIIAQLTNTSAGLNIERDLQAIASVAPQANIVAAAPDLPVSSLKDAMELAGKRPLTYSSPGTGSVPQLLLAHVIASLPGAQITHVPFAGAAPALTSTLSSQTDLTIVTLPPAIPLVNSGKLKGLAVTTTQRTTALPQVPTATEAGYPGMSGTVWTAFFVPAATPKPVSERLSRAVLDAAATPEIRNKLIQLGFEPDSSGGEQFQRDVLAELNMWRDVVRQVGGK